MKSPIGKFLAVVTWFITALVSLNEGAEALGYGAKTWNMFASDPKLMMYCHYVAGVAGLISLIMLIGALACGGCCGERSCDKGGPRGVCPKCNSNPCRCSHM